MDLGNRDPPWRDDKQTRPERRGINHGPRANVKARRG
jgi:hypothetical protein